MMLKRPTYAKPRLMEPSRPRVGRRFDNGEVLLQSSMELSGLQILVLVAITHESEHSCGLKWRMFPWEQQLATGQPGSSSRCVSLALSGEPAFDSGLWLLSFVALSTSAQIELVWTIQCTLGATCAVRQLKQLGDTLFVSRKSLLFLLTSNKFLLGVSVLWNPDSDFGKERSARNHCQATRPWCARCTGSMKSH